MNITADFEEVPASIPKKIEAAIQQSKCRSRWAIIRNIHLITKNREAGNSWGEIAKLLSKNESVKIGRAGLARLMAPVAEDDPTPHIVNEMRGEVGALGKLVEFYGEVERALRGPGRPAGKVSSGPSVSTTTTPLPAASDSILNVRSSHPSVAERVRLEIEKSNARKAAAAEKPGKR